MKYAFLSLGMVGFGIVGIGFITAFENITINNESEYFVLKDAVKASMYESIDLRYYSQLQSTSPDIKIVKEKFVANCTRRFFKSISGSGKGYQLTFYDIMENPPKVSVVARSKTDSYAAVGLGGENGFDIANDLSAILEFNPVEHD